MLMTCYTEAMFMLIPSSFVYSRLTFHSCERRMYVQLQSEIFNPPKDFKDLSIKVFSKSKILLWMTSL